MIDSDRLDDYRFQMGHDAGNLALVLDQLTDAITALNQHMVYSRLGPGDRKTPPPDLARSRAYSPTRRGWCKSRCCG